jgi:glycosyltransferase involved in cell wall biosynthesis
MLIQYIRQKYNIPADSKVIISVGRNHVVKGFKYAIEAFSLIAKEIHNVYFIIVGRGTESLDELAINLGVEDRLVLTGQITNRQELVRFYKFSDIYLSSSLIESFGITNVEALASGLPLILTNVLGNRDLHDASYSFLIESESPKAMAEACIKLLHDDSLRKKMGDAALVNAQKYDWSIIAKQYIASYLKAIEIKVNR